MAHRHVMAIYRATRLVTAFVRGQVGDDLVPIEIKVNPFGCAASFRTSQQFTVESTSLCNITHGESQMERDSLWGGHMKAFGVLMFPNFIHDPNQ